MWFQKAPLFRFVLMFVTGIVAYFLLPVGYISFFGWTAVSLVLLFAAFVAVYLRRTSSVIWFGISFLAGLWTAFIHDDKNASNFIGNTKNNKEVFTEIQVDENPVMKNNYTRAKCKILRKIQRDSSYSVCGDAMVYFKNTGANIIRYGDVYIGRLQLLPTDTAKQNPYTFDYNRYLKNKGIEYLSFVEYNRLVFQENTPPNYLKSLALRIKNIFLEIIAQFSATENSKALISALVTGDKSDVDEETVKSFSAAGITHILAVSGLHVGIIYMVFSFLISFLKNAKFYSFFRPMFLLICLWLYAAVTGFSPSVTRASLMFSVIVIGEAVNRQSNIYNSIALSALILLISNPYNIFEVGFQLSYAAVLGIVSLQPEISKIFAPKIKIILYLWELTAVSIAAQIATFPLSLYYFHQFPVYFIFSNLPAIPVATALLYLSLFSLVVYPWTFLFHSVSWLAGKLAALLIFLSEKIMQLPSAVWQGIYISKYEVVLIYLMIFMIGSYLFFRRKTYLYVALMSLYVFYGIRVIHEYRASEQSKILVFNVKGNSVIELVNGMESIRLSLKDIDSKELNFRVWPVEQALGLKVKKVDFNSDFETGFAKKKGNVLQFKNKILYLYNDKNQSYPAYFIDYLIVSKNTPLYKISDKIHPNTRVIFDSSNSVRFIRFWSKKISGRARIARPDTNQLLEIDC
jgi:competence protein ComEC